MEIDRNIKWIGLIIFLFFLLILVSVISLGTGSTFIKIGSLLDILINQQNSPQHSIIMNIRLPRLILGFAVGGSLSLAGTLLQSVFKNPLIEPYTLGISGGASLGVCLNIVFKIYLVLGVISYPLTGFLGALCTVFFLYLFCLSKSKTHLNNILLTGVMISFIASSVMMLIMSISTSEDITGIVFWIMGSLDETNNFLIGLVLISSLICLLISFLFCIELNIMSLGEEEAKFMGVKVERLKMIVFILASILTGLSVSVSGVIGFVGLVVPHFMRFFTGIDHRILLISSFLAGSCFLIICDTIARTVISPLELPVGVITGIIGGIIFVYALSKKRVKL